VLSSTTKMPKDSTSIILSHGIDLLFHSGSLNHTWSVLLYAATKPTSKGPSIKGCTQPLSMLW
jgi:hypothetical protein